MRAFCQAGKRSLRERAGRILVGAALGVLLAVAPAAGQLSVGGAHLPNKNTPIVFQADEVQYDEQHGLTIAKGHVEISQGGDVLLADTVTYNQHTGAVTASGHVSLLQPTGEVLFSNFMELRDQMKDAFATNVRMLLADRSRLAAAAARRVNGNRLELARVVYSPCDLCRKDPTAPPEWEIKARQVSDDKLQKLIEFRDMTLDLYGWPIFYSPYLSEPEPSVKRASGFLIPSAGNSSNNGFHFSIPYFLVLDSDKDLTLDPRYFTSAGPMLVNQYRERFGNGYLDGTGSINYSNVGLGSSSHTGDRLRGHIDASGLWDLDETYRTGFQLQRVSDQTYLQRFGFGQPLLNAMVTRAYLQGFDPRGATDVDAYLFQPLQPGLSDSTQPIVLPVINRTWISEPDGLGGRWTLNGNLLDIVREVGTQTRRLAGKSEWDKTFRDGIGGEYHFTASVLGEGYSVSNLSNLSNPDLPSAYFAANGNPLINPNFITARAFPQIGLTWNYPLAHRGENTTAIVEPIAGIYAGPNGGNSRRVPDEDSFGFEFNASDLFRPDRLAGYDILDTGQRVDYGLKLGLYNKDGGNYHMLIGQSYRAERNVFLPSGSGAEQRLSDVVGRLILQPSSFLDLVYRFRLDKRTLGLRAQEVGLATGPPNLRFGVNYLLEPAQQVNEAAINLTNGQSIVYGKREQVAVSASTRLTRYWSLAASETLNLTNSQNLINGVFHPQSANTSLNANLSAIYQDECMAFIASVTQSGITNGDVKPGVSVLFSVVFKNLGEIGGTVLSMANAPAIFPQ